MLSLAWRLGNSDNGQLSASIISLTLGHCSPSTLLSAVALLQMLRACVEDTRPVMDHMLHSLKSSRHPAEDLGMSNSVASLEAFLERRISCGEQLNREHQENSMAMSMPYAHKQTDSLADSGASGAVKCQEMHFKRLEQGLQESSLCELDCPGTDSKAPNIMLQPAKQLTNCRERALDRVLQRTVKLSMQQPRCRRKSVHLPNLSSQLGQSASVQSAGREDGMLSLAPIDASPRCATFAHTDKTASDVISALYDRVRPANSATSGPNLRFRWNRQLVIIQGTKAGALSACCLL